MKTPNAVLWGMAALMAAGLTEPLTVRADSPAKQESSKRQGKKNNWRNGAIGAGAVGLYGALKGDKTTAILGAAGAAYSAKRYEDERKRQDERKRASARYHRSGGNYVKDGRKYYRYNGRMYYKDLSTGERHPVN